MRAPRRLVDIEAQPAVLAMGDRDRLGQLIATALSISAYAARPYRAATRARSLVEALARAQRLQVACDDLALTVRLRAAVGAASV